MHRIRTFTVAVLLAGVRGLQPLAALAANRDRGYRGDRVEDGWDAGTTGLIVGGMAGGVLGHVIAPGGSKTLGTILGAGAGALIGRMINDGDVVCR